MSAPVVHSFGMKHARHLQEGSFFRRPDNRIWKVKKVLAPAELYAITVLCVDYYGLRENAFNIGNFRKVEFLKVIENENNKK